MSIYVNNVLRIKRNAADQAAMKKLIDANVFSGYKDILMISAIIGYNENKYVPIEKTASDGVLMSFFTGIDYDIFDLLAYSRNKEQKVIKSDEKYEIFSSYANAGFPILLKKLDFNPEEDINEDMARKLQSKYYSLLLSGDFLPKVETVSDEDLFI